MMKSVLKRAFMCLTCCVLLFVLSACENDENSSDVLTGNKWETSSGMLLDLQKDGTFKWYNNKADRKNNYYTGEFKAMSGKTAIDYLAETQGFPEENQRAVMSRYSVPENCYYVLVLHNKERIQDGKNTLEEENELSYYGYYKPDYEKLTLYNLDSLSPYEFTKM